MLIRSDALLLCGARAEPHGLAGGWPARSHGLALPFHALDQPHGLEELEAVRLVEKLLSHRTMCSPARGGHRRTTPSRCFEVRTSCEKELTEA